MMGDRKVVVGSKWRDNGGSIHKVTKVTGDGYGRKSGEVTTTITGGGEHTWYNFHGFHPNGWISDPWAPEAGKQAKIVSVRGCCGLCEDAAIEAGLAEGQIRKVSKVVDTFKSCGGIYEFDGVEGGHIVILGEPPPAPLYIPACGERVKITAVHPDIAKRSYKPINVGDVVTTHSTLHTFESSSHPGYVWLDTNEGVGGWVRCEKAPAFTVTLYDIAYRSLVDCATRRRFEVAYGKLGPNAQALIADIAERLAVGAAEHGDFDKPRTAAEWGKEAYEEDLDALVYRTLRLKAAEGAAA